MGAASDASTHWIRSSPSTYPVISGASAHSFASSERISDSGTHDFDFFLPLLPVPFLEPFGRTTAHVGSVAFTDGPSIPPSITGAENLGLRTLGLRGLPPPLGFFFRLFGFGWRLHLLGVLLLFAAGASRLLSLFGGRKLIFNLLCTSFLPICSGGGPSVRFGCGGHFFDKSVIFIVEVGGILP